VNPANHPLQFSHPTTSDRMGHRLPLLFIRLLKESAFRQHPARPRPANELPRRNLESTRRFLEADFAPRFFLKTAPWMVGAFHDPAAILVYLSTTASTLSKGSGCATCHVPVEPMPLMYQENSPADEMGALEFHRNPENSHPVPKDQVFNMAYEAPVSRMNSRPRRSVLVKEYKIAGRGTAHQLLHVVTGKFLDFAAYQKSLLAAPKGPLGPGAASRAVDSRSSFREYWPVNSRSRPRSGNDPQGRREFWN